MVMLMVYSLAIGLFVLSFIYYQHSSLASMRHDHAAKVLELELSISDLRSGLTYLKLDLLETRSRSNSSSPSRLQPISDSKTVGKSKSAETCVPLEYARYDRAIWSGSDSERDRLHSDLALYAEHPCYRDAPELLWRFAVSLYYRAALLPSTLAAPAATSSAARANQIALLGRANDTINRARELTRHMDPRVLKWSALINGYAFDLKGDVKSRLEASFHFKATIDRAIQLDPNDPQSLNGRANWGILISGITKGQRLLAQQFFGTVPTARLSDAISDALSADRLYRAGVRLFANGSVVPLGNGTPQAAALEVRPPGASKPTLTLLALSYERTLDRDFDVFLAAAREAYALPATTWEDREANKELAKLSRNNEMRFD